MVIYIANGYLQVDDFKSCHVDIGRDAAVIWFYGNCIACINKITLLMLVFGWR